MPYTLAEAAAACGIDKSTVRRAVRSGRISGTRDDVGVWHVEPVELHRVFPPMERTSDDAAVAPHLLELKLQHAQERIIDLTQQLERALGDIADWKEQAKRIALPAPVPAGALPAPAWWRRVRAW
jgi:hypothetical protein